MWVSSNNDKRKTNPKPKRKKKEIPRTRSRKCPPKKRMKKPERKVHTKLPRHAEPTPYLQRREEEKTGNFGGLSHWNGIQANPIELSKGLEYCATAAEELMAVVVAAIGVESISRHFCSQWREGQRSETPCSSICCRNRQQKNSIHIVLGWEQNDAPSH